jgi:hypothetical protein
MNNNNKVNDNFDPINDWIGQIVIVENVDKRYAAKLIAINGNELWFESKIKARWMQARSEIKYLGLAVRQVV